MDKQASKEAKVREETNGTVEDVGAVHTVNILRGVREENGSFYLKLVITNNNQFYYEQLGNLERKIVVIGGKELTQ